MTLPAGKLTAEITLERKVETVAPSGAISTVWTPYATLRAEPVAMSTDEYLSGSTVERETVAAVFRIRTRPDISLADRIVYKGRTYDLREVVELGRRVLELRGVAAP